ncbi:uncharacterized protein LOC119521744 isoform X4 [Choloepus didactylus]|uniref:uncharacterized protein LOC119521744 isoform X4 n=1 Tax=Choloepus didactylus TaxID=27675 RepID=UPI00189E430F|nr:uncharacterized protein LOC119521744 isoform X4 [Choloepus didactylus]
MGWLVTINCPSEETAQWRDTQRCPLLAGAGRSGSPPTSHLLPAAGQALAWVVRGPLCKEALRGSPEPPPQAPCPIAWSGRTQQSHLPDGCPRTPAPLGEESASGRRRHPAWISASHVLMKHWGFCVGITA